MTNLKLHLSTALLLSIAFAPVTPAYAANSSQTIKITQPTQIPDVVLDPGSYVFSVEDHLQDRSIVRISTFNNEKHYLVLAVSNPETGKGTPKPGVVMFPSGTDKEQAIKGWNGLQFVYPKLEAVKITNVSGSPVMAVDPAYDKLPSDLSPDDMKVVTLWLLAPKTVTPDHHGEGVTANKYASVKKQGDTVGSLHNGSETQVASTRHLPKTASNSFTLFFLGFAALFASLLLRTLRMRRDS